MTKEKYSSNRVLIIITVLSILLFSLASPAQKPRLGPTIAFSEDTAINPHDFTDDYYAQNGVLSKLIVGRRTGKDFLSVFSKTSNPTQSDVRVLITLPAYGQDETIRFWSPLGQLYENGFTDDRAGMLAREIAKSFPIYVFPQKMDLNSSAFTNNRQAALIDDSWSTYDGNPIGLRSIVLVNYTPKAYEKEGIAMMAFMGKKNGLSIDNTPIIRSVQDLNLLAKEELVSFENPVFRDDTPYGGVYAISPVIQDPTKGAIAWDAFLSTVTRDGTPLESEVMFVSQFNCLKKTGAWCSTK